MESYLGYQFAYANPLTFSDPTGAFSVAELNAGQVIDRIISNLPQTLWRQVAQEIVETAQGIVTDALTDMLMSVISPLAQFDAMPFASTLSEAGDVFESIAEDGVCGLFEDSDFGDGLFLAVPMNRRNGEAVANGLNCSQRDRGRGGRGPGRFRGVSSAGVSFPDFLFGRERPLETIRRGRGRKDYLVGDFKLTLQRPRGRGKRQLVTMGRHASARGALRVTMVIALRGSSDAERAIERRIVRQGSIPMVETLF